MMDTRVHHASPFSPLHDQPPERPTGIDRTAQRIVAYAAAGGVVLAIVLWLARVATFDARLTATEALVREVKANQDALIEMNCATTRKVDANLEFRVCRRMPP